jgi:hypothetical protein
MTEQSPGDANKNGYLDARPCNVGHRLRNVSTVIVQKPGVGLTVIALCLGHESSETTFMYVQADMPLKERALAHAGPSGQALTRFRPSDELLAFLDGL